MGKTIEERMLYLYENKYAKEFDHLPEVRALKEKQRIEKEELKRKIAEKRNESARYSEHEKNRNRLFAALGGACAGMCVTSAFFLGLGCFMLFFIGFIVFAACYKSTEKNSKKEDFERRSFFIEDDKQLQELERQHYKEYRLLIVNIAIEKGYIFFYT